jgi:hypothetical protein
METTLSLKKVGKKFGERTNNLYDTISNQTTNAEITDAEIRKVILENKEVMPKLLQMLFFPTVSWQRVAGLRNNIPVFKAEYIRKKLIARLEVCRVLARKGEKYKDCDYKSKNNIRKLQAKLMFESGLFGLIPVLPHFDWLGEIFMDKLTDKNVYLGIANNKYVYEGASINRELLGINGTMVFGEMLDILKQYPSNSFAHIGMDFCGVLPIQIESVIYAINNDLLQVGGYIFLTVKRIVRNAKNGYSDEYNMFKAMNTPDTKLTNSDFANDKLLISKLGDNYKLEVKKTYQTGSPMVFYAIKRIK